MTLVRLVSHCEDSAPTKGTVMVQRMTDATDVHDHAWRRSDTGLTSSHHAYRCDLCSLTWSGFVPTIDEDGRSVRWRG